MGVIGKISEFGDVYTKGVGVRLQGPKNGEPNEKYIENERETTVAHEF